MVKPMDISKFRKNLTKNIDGISTGFHDPDVWVDTGNYCLNYTISGKFNRGIPLGQVAMFAGESGSGKSYVAANIMKNAQNNDIFVLAIDTENGLTNEWLTKAGVDTSEDKFMRIQLALVDDVAKTIDKFMEDYIATYKDLPKEEHLKVLIVIDSLGMLITKTDIDQFKSGDLKGDMGRKPKALNALIRNCVVKFAEWNIGLVCTNHTYASQDMFSPDPKVSGGSSFIYASSLVVALQQLKLKEDTEGEKTTSVNGIRSKMKCIKTRYCKPFESVEIKIPYKSGMNPYSGLIDFFEKQELLQKDGNKLKYIDLDGNEHKYFRKRIPETLLDKMIEEFEQQNIKIENNVSYEENNDSYEVSNISNEE